MLILHPPTSMVRKQWKEISESQKSGVTVPRVRMCPLGRSVSINLHPQSRAEEEEEGHSFHIWSLFVTFQLIPARPENQTSFANSAVVLL